MLCGGPINECVLGPGGVTWLGLGLGLGLGLDALLSACY